jgi:DNA repair protein RadC
VLHRGAHYTSSKAVYDHFHTRMRSLKRECIICLLLDAKNRVQKEVEIASGGLSAATAKPRDILRAAIADSAHAIILLHNHPSGDDVRFTSRVKEATELAGIRFLDHIIIGEEGYVSLADEGRI